MSLQAITKRRDFFTPCAERAEIIPSHLETLFNNLKQPLVSGQNKELTEERLKTLDIAYSKLLMSSSLPTLTPIIHYAAQYKPSKSILELCVKRRGRSILETGTSSYGQTAIFATLGSYTLLKRITTLGANVNAIMTVDKDVCAKHYPFFNSNHPEYTVLEKQVEKAPGKDSELSQSKSTPSPLSFNLSVSATKRCIKHLLGLGACIQKNTPLSLQEKNYLVFVCREFATEIQTVVGKMQTLAQHAFSPALQTLILEFAIEEEDSEYDSRYALNDESEAFAFIKKDQQMMTTKRQIVESFLPPVLSTIVIDYATCPEEPFVSCENDTTPPAQSKTLTAPHKVIVCDSDTDTFYQWPYIW